MIDQTVKNIISRRTEKQYPSRDEVIQRLTEEKLTFYFGVDPTGPDIHLGHTAPLLLLKQLAELGHKAIVLIGDFTGRIGDPTDKMATRVSLTPEQITENERTYIEQIARVLPRELFEVRYNSEWLAEMNLTKILELTSLVTVQQMLVRDMFQERLKQEKPIHIHEFLYPLMQGYDSVAMAVDGEVGATDQIFNMLVGRDLSEHLLGKNKIVLATRLIIDSGTGKKMSKSEGTLIAVTDDPQTIREKVLNAIGDEIIQTVFELCTEKEQSWIDQRQADIKAGKNPRVWKEELADELIRMYHGASGVTAARQAKEFSISEPVRIDALLKELEVVSSLSGAKQLIKGNGVRVNDVVITQWDHVVQKGDRVQVGAGKFFLLN